MASGRPPGVSTVRESRRGHEDDVILARGNQYSTGPASASHSFSTKLQLGKKEKRWQLTFAECLQQAEILLIPAAWRLSRASLRTDHAYVSGRLGQLFSGFLIRGRALIRGMAENSHTNQVR